MLESLISSISSRPELTEHQRWSHRVSANTLELLVKPNYHLDAEEYRMGVIEIGRVLQAIEEQLTGTGRMMQLQSFPSIGESRLAALIRVQKIYGAVKVNGTAHSAGQVGERTFVKKSASEFGLSCQPASQAVIGQIAETIDSADSPAINDKQYWCLCSSLDNPFIWLKTGRWTEKTLISPDSSSLESSQINYTLSQQSRFDLGKLQDYCNQVQALIQFDTPIC